MLAALRASETGATLTPGNGGLLEPFEFAGDPGGAPHASSAASSAATVRERRAPRSSTRATTRTQGNGRRPTALPEITSSVNARKLAAEIIAQADADLSNGSLTVNELKTYLTGRKYRRFLAWLTTDRAHNFKAFDADHSGSIELPELVSAIEGFAMLLKAEDAQRALENFKLTTGGAGREAEGEWRQCVATDGARRWLLHSRGGTRISQT